MSHAHLSRYKHTLSHAHLLVSAVCSMKLCPFLTASLRGATPTNRLMYELYRVLSSREQYHVINSSRPHVRHYCVQA